MADEAPVAEAPAITPETASEIPAVTPTPETAPVSTATPVEAPIDSAGEDAGGVEGYLAEKEKALKGGGTPAPAEAAPAETPPPVTPPAVTPPAVTPPAETPAAAATPPAETPAAPAPPAEPETPDRIRIGALSDGHLVAAATNIAREEKITFAEAFERVRPKPAATPPPAAPETNGLRSRADVEAEITATREERRNAAAGADKLEQGAAGKMVAAEEKLEALKLELGQVESAEQRAEADRQRAEETEFGRAVSVSKAQAVEYWPDAGVDGSDFSNRMLELSDLYEKDARLAHHVYEAEAPFFFAELVAKELKLLPVHLQKKETPAAAPVTPEPKPSTPPATKPAPLNQRAVLRTAQPAAGPASGAARTTAEAPTDDLGIDKIKSVADYEKVKKKVLNPQQPVPA